MSELAPRYEGCVHHNKYTYMYVDIFTIDLFLIGRIFFRALPGGRVHL